MSAEKAAEQQHELAALYPAPRSMTIAGRAVEIRRCTISQAGRIIDAGAPLQQLVNDGIEPVDLFDAMPDETTKLIVAATGLEHDFVSGLDPLDKLAIAKVWFEVNGAFFVHRLLPARAGFNRALTALFGVGPTSSTAFIATVTSPPATTPPKLQPDTSTPSTAPSGEIAKAA